MTDETIPKPQQRTPLGEVKASLLYLKSLGLEGVACTDEAAKILGTLGRVAPQAGQGSRRVAPVGQGAKPKAQVAAPGGQKPVAVRPVPVKPVVDSVERSPQKTVPQATPPQPASVRRPAIDPMEESLDSIRSDMGECTRCHLFRGRNQIVFGAGNPKARLMFVGDMPLSQEDQEGLPFLGASGELLNKMIQAMGLSRDDVYLSNVLKCCPSDPQHRPDMTLCLSFLERQIAVVRPEVICALGAVATQTLLGMTSGVGGIRGQFQNYRGRRLMPTYHPTFLLRHPEHKRQAWQDLQQVMAVLGLGNRR